MTGGSAIYAILETGGKQYRVAQGQRLDVDRLAVEEGQQIVLDRVLLVADGADVRVGQPVVSGAQVVATVVDHHKAPKVIIFKFKNKTRYHRKTGHRQPLTRLAIDEIRLDASEGSKD